MAGAGPPRGCRRRAQSGPPNRGCGIGRRAGGRARKHGVLKHVGGALTKLAGTGRACAPVGGERAAGAPLDILVGLCCAAAICCCGRVRLGRGRGACDGRWVCMRAPLVSAGQGVPAPYMAGAVQACRAARVRPCAACTPGAPRPRVCQGGRAGAPAPVLSRHRLRSERPPHACSWRRAGSPAGQCILSPGCSAACKCCRRPRRGLRRHRWPPRRGRGTRPRSGTARGAHWQRPWLCLASLSRSPMRRNDASCS